MAYALEFMEHRAKFRVNDASLGAMDVYVWSDEVVGKESSQESFVVVFHGGAEGAHHQASFPFRIRAEEGSWNHRILADVLKTALLQMEAGAVYRGVRLEEIPDMAEGPSLPRSLEFADASSSVSVLFAGISIELEIVKYHLDDDSFGHEFGTRELARYAVVDELGIRSPSKVRELGESVLANVICYCNEIDIVVAPADFPDV